MLFWGSPPVAARRKQFLNHKISHGTSLETTPLALFPAKFFAILSSGSLSEIDFRQ